MEVKSARWLLGLVIVFVCAACTTSNTSTPSDESGGETTAQQGSIQISASEVSDEWPLTVDSGTLSCEPPSSVTFTTPDGTTYAVNGTAQTLSVAPDIDPIWKDDPDVPGAKINIGELIDRGLALCGE
jgi:hypothetical protein